MTAERLVVLPGDVLARLRELPDASVQMCATSPPYWGLRDYGHADQIGLEETPDAYVARLVEVFREVRRVLRDDGTLWLNLGDSYFGDSPVRKASSEAFSETWDATQTRSRGGTRRSAQSVEGLKSKDLVGIPWRVAFALQADGWWLRQDIIWIKPNPMPESVTDRCTKSHEYIFLLTKAARYFYDAEAIKEAVTENMLWRAERGHTRGQGKVDASRNDASTVRPTLIEGTTRNRRDVWTVNTKPYPEAHFATWPEDLVKPMILAGTSARGCCPVCGAPWARTLEKVGVVNTKKATTGWQPTCDCERSDVVPCRVLDPFAGSGTTGAVALQLGRAATLIELNPEYVQLIERRCRVTLGLPGF